MSAVTMDILNDSDDATTKSKRLTDSELKEHRK
jgi:hypothetical protein